MPICGYLPARHLPAGDPLPAAEPVDATQRLIDWVWYAVWVGLSSVWCFTAAAQIGPTFDETLYVAEGLKFWRTGSHFELLRVGTTPLVMDVATLPIYLWERWRGTPFDAAADLALVLPWARAALIVFWWLLLFYAGRIGRSLGGVWAGRLTVALLACEPNFLAHASLVTADVGVTACLLALLFHFRRGRDAGWGRRVGLPAFWYGVALLTKVSALAYGPLCMGVIELERLWREGAFTAREGETGRDVARRVYGLGRAACRDLWQIGVLGFVLLFVACGCDWLPEKSFVKWAHALQGGTTRQVMVWLSEHLCVFNNAGNALVRQIRHNMMGHGTYLLGEQWPRAVWYYFPVAMSIKFSLPLLLLPPVLFALGRRGLANWACLAACALLVFSLNCRVQIGVRFMLPLVALAAAGLAAAATQAYSSAPWGRLRRGLLVGLLGVGLGWMALSSALVWPHGLCYTNEAWGGTENGYRRLSDSNYDWGQGIGELAAWQRDRGVETLDVLYFGTDPALATLPMHKLTFEEFNARADAPHARYLAVGASVLYGNLGDIPAYRLAVRSLSAHRPVARTSTFFIFDADELGESKARAGR
jgi:hypothetical protein